MATGVKEFTAAYKAWDGQRFGVAAELFRQASTNAPGSCTNFYLPFGAFGWRVRRPYMSYQILTKDS